MPCANKELLLSLEESKRLYVCELVIEHGLQSFIEVGNALLEIRDARLYRQEFQTFENYCQERWAIERAHAYRLIDAVQVTLNLSPIGDKPTHESQVRPLSKLEPEQQREAWELARLINPNPTAADTQRAANIVQRAVRDAFRDASKEAEVNIEARTPIAGKPNPDFDDRWIDLIGAVARIMRIEPFDVLAIAAQEFRVSDASTIKDQISKCEEAILRIRMFITEIGKRSRAHAHV